MFSPAFCGALHGGSVLRVLDVGVVHTQHPKPSNSNFVGHNHDLGARNFEKPSRRGRDSKPGAMGHGESALTTKLTLVGERERERERERVESPSANHHREATTRLWVWKFASMLSIKVLSPTVIARDRCPCHLIPLLAGKLCCQTPVV